jgi:hypothetical protein
LLAVAVGLAVKAAVAAAVLEATEAVPVYPFWVKAIR